MRPKPQLTPEHIEKYVKGQTTLKELSKEIRLSVSTVAEKLKDAGCKMAKPGRRGIKWLKDIKPRKDAVCLDIPQHFLDSYDRGEQTVYSLARLLNRSYYAVRLALKANKVLIKRRKKPERLEKENAIRRDRRRGYSIKTIMDKHNLKYYQVYRILRQQ